MSTRNLPMPLMRVFVEGTDLTERELDVLFRIALGDSQIEAARELGISPESVRKHAKAARARLGARTNCQAVAIAISLDLI